MTRPGTDPPPLVFDPAARQELVEAVACYDAQRTGLGDEFVAEVKHASTRVRDFPMAWQPVSRRSRRCRLHRFPYGLVYQVLPTEIACSPSHT